MRDVAGFFLPSRFSCGRRYTLFLEGTLFSVVISNHVAFSSFKSVAIPPRAELCHLTDCIHYLCSDGLRCLYSLTKLMRLTHVSSIMQRTSYVRHVVYLSCLAILMVLQIAFILLAMCLGEENASVLCVDVDPCGLKWRLSYNICSQLSATAGGHAIDLPFFNEELRSIKKRVSIIRTVNEYL